MKKTHLSIILLSVVISVFLLTSCETQLSDKELKARLIEANTGMDTYSMDMKVNMDMLMVINGQEQAITSQIDYKGKVDRINKKMAMTGTGTFEMGDMSIEMDVETYVIDNYVYTKTLDAKQKLELNADLWEEQDQINQYTDLINSGNIKRLEDDSFDGKDFYVIRIIPDLAEVVKSALKQQNQEGLFNLNMDFDDMIKSYTATVWVNKETFVIEKLKANMKMVLTPANMGMTEAEGFDRMEMDSLSEITMYDINEEVVIDFSEAEFMKEPEEPDYYM